MLPTGTVTFLFTDIEGSTQLLQQAPEDFPALLEKHNRIIREAFSAHGGSEIDNTGDGFFFVFSNPTDAVKAADAAQRSLASYPWDPDRVVQVRMGIHTGMAELRGDTYIGLDVHKAARIMGAAYGGQVLISQAVSELVDPTKLDGVSFFAIGEFRLKDLPQPEVLYQLLLEGAMSPLPRRREVKTQKTNLPARPTPLLGRQVEIESIQARLGREDVRLLTLAGPGGIGKSSLAIEAARTLQDDFPDGVYVVFLAPVMDAQFIPSAIAQVLGFFLNTGIPVIEQLKDFIGEKRLLLILDNFEHLVQASGTLIPLLESCPYLKILVTSRIVLKVQWEWEHPVPPLQLTRSGRGKQIDVIQPAPSVELFLQRARAVNPQFAPLEEDHAVIAEICDRLDGLPLAIELAAARINVLSPSAILSRLCKTLDLLKGSRKDLPERHQTLRHAVGWSYDLLEEDEKALFRMLGVYAGGFSLDTAEALHAELTGAERDGLEVITSLRDQSLIRVADTDRPEPRYMMLATIREFALERLKQEGDVEAARKAHAQWFLARAEEAYQHLTGPQSRQWLDEIEADLDNYRAALHWAEERREAAIGLGLCIALWRFWVIRAFLQEGVEHLTKQLAYTRQLTGINVLKAKALNVYGTLLHEISDYRGAAEVLE